ncbi:MAG: DUF2470 domain-containing protein [Calditrichia bacterium]
MADKHEDIRLARALFQEEKHALLSTNSVRMPAFPLGSFTAYCLNNSGQPVVLINSIGQEAENIMESRHVSLAIAEKKPAGINKCLSVTCLAEASRPEPEELDEIAEQYYHYFPEFRGYHETNEFNFFTLELREIRIQRSIHNIFWIRPEEFTASSPFSKSVVQRIVSHMNDDHQDALKYLLAEHKNHLVNGDSVEMVGINGDGFDLRVDSQFFRIQFDSPVTTLMEARKTLMAMTKLD